MYKHPLTMKRIFRIYSREFIHVKGV